MGVESDRKQLASKRKLHEEAKREAVKLRSAEADKVADANRSHEAAAQLGKKAQVAEKKAGALAKDIQKLDARIAKAGG